MSFLPTPEEMKTLEPLRPKEMTPEHFRTVAETKHKEMLDAFTPEIVAAIEGKTIEDKDFCIALIQIGEDLISEEMKYQMQADGVDTAFIAGPKENLIDLLRGFESPRTQTKPFLPLAAALSAHKAGHTPVVAMCFQNASLFHVEVGELQKNIEKEKARIAAIKAKRAAEEAALNASASEPPQDQPAVSESSEP